MTAATDEGTNTPADATQAGSVKADPINTDPINTDPINTDPINTDPINTDSSTASSLPQGSVPREAPAAGLVLRRSERLLNSYGFKRVLRFGRCFRHSAMRIHFKESSYELSRMGLVVSKKNGNAPVRNLIKRRMREVFRRSKSRLPFTQDVVFIPNPAHGPATLDEYQHVLDEFIEWVKRHRHGPSRKGRARNGDREPRKKRRET